MHNIALANLAADYHASTVSPPPMHMRSDGSVDYFDNLQQMGSMLAADGVASVQTALGNFRYHDMHSQYTGAGLSVWQCPVADAYQAGVAVLGRQRLPRRFCGQRQHCLSHQQTGAISGLGARAQRRAFRPAATRPHRTERIAGRSRCRHQRDNPAHQKQQPAAAKPERGAAPGCDEKTGFQAAAGLGAQAIGQQRAVTNGSSSFTSDKAHATIYSAMLDDIF